MNTKPKHVAGMLLGLTLASGVMDAREVARGAPSPGWTLLSTVLFSFLVFYWYRLDSDQHLYRRSRWLNLGVLLLAFVAIPYYLVRSRPRGGKRRALLRLAGFCALSLAVAVAGGLAYDLSAV